MIKLEAWVLFMLAITNLLFAIFMLYKGRVIIYSLIWEIQNVNTVGKILLSIILTPFTIFSTIFICLCILSIYAFIYLLYWLKLLFAQDKDKVKHEFRCWFYGYCDSCKSPIDSDFTICTQCNNGSNFKTE